MKTNILKYYENLIETVTIVRVAKIVGSYQISVEGNEEETTELVKVVDALAKKIDTVHPTENKEPDSRTADVVTTPSMPAIPGANSAPEAITKLFNSDWGSIPRTIREIKETLDANGLFYPTTSLSGVLISLARQGKLRRWKTSKGYSYIKGMAA